eukprot:358514-Chlamydomonas_euryale.AAC.6
MRQSQDALRCTGCSRCQAGSGRTGRQLWRHLLAGMDTERLHVAVHLFERARFRALLCGGDEIERACAISCTLRAPTSMHVANQEALT